MFFYLIKRIVIELALGLFIILLLNILNKKLDKYKNSLSSDLEKIKNIRQNLLLYGASSIYETRLATLDEDSFIVWCQNYLSILGYKNIEFLKNNPIVQFCCYKDKEKYYVKCKNFNIEEKEEGFSPDLFHELLGEMVKDKIEAGLIITPYFINNETKDLLYNYNPKLNIEIEDKEKLLSNCIKHKIKI